METVGRGFGFALPILSFRSGKKKDSFCIANTTIWQFVEYQVFVICKTKERKKNKIRMFNREKRKQKLLEAINMIKPTSKAELKRQCLMLSNLDVDKAEKMYNFLIDGLEDIPAVEPASKPFLQNIGEQTSGFFDWIRKNEDVMKQGVDMIRGIVEKRKGIPAPPANPLPPING